MAMSNAEKQAAFRQRALKAGGRERLQAVVSGSAKRALERLARHFGVSQVDALEKIILDAQARELEGMTIQEQAKYSKD